MPTTDTERERLFIDGQRVPATDGEWLTTEDPATGEAIASVPEANAPDVDRAVEAAESAFPDWRDVSPSERGRLLRAVAAEIRDCAHDLAELESRDQGKPLSQARRDIEGAARYFEYYAGAADKLEGTTVPVESDRLDYTVREPYGVSAQIIPWNFPANIFARGVAPALAAGNATVVKPSPTTPLSALRLAELCQDAGLPDGVVNVVTGGAEPGAALTGHEDVDAITFTGSVPTGQRVMEAAAETITPVTLELGGKNPAVVFPDADLDEAVSWIATGIFTNAGQVCSAADRALVHEDVYEEFVDRIVAVANAYELDAGLDDPDMGPLNHAAHREKVEQYIRVGREEGATVAAGGGSLDRDGHFVEPTVFTDVSPEMRIAREEIFGPVLTVVPFSDVDEAIAVANDVEFGLAGGVFTRDVKRAHAVAGRIDAGTVYVNEWFGDRTATPFGGYKRSGIGREKGLEALDSYLQTKNVALSLDEGHPDVPGL
ncbi:aldehyde dehydrogenase family protein [Halorussus marinus]|uniref:aldehyde dehydrogenase family protein n=1 Tax=Halorussus marinus TaxID=2505976 RepID=UPI00109227FF|nr:aldehyde dehydrogenase family protein [Halorussus marinus]